MNKDVEVLRAATQLAEVADIAATELRTRGCDDAQLLDGLTGWAEQVRQHAALSAEPVGDANPCDAVFSNEAIICECCDAAEPDSEYSAACDGWRKSWDGWLCGRCMSREDQDAMGYISGPNLAHLKTGDDVRVAIHSTRTVGYPIPLFLERRLAQPQRQTIVGWIHEDELPNGYPYEAMFPHSKVDGVRMFPVFAPSDEQPQRQAATEKPREVWSAEAIDLLKALRDQFDTINHDDDGDVYMNVSCDAMDEIDRFLEDRATLEKL